MLLDQLFNRTSGVAETSDYARRREREEAIISGKKPPRKKQPAQTSDYARRRAQEKAKDQGVAKGSVTKKPQPYNDPNWIQKLSKEQLDALSSKKPNKENKKPGVAEGQAWWSGATTPAGHKIVAKQNEKIQGNKFVYQGYVIEFKPTEYTISKALKTVYKKSGDYSQPTRLNLAAARRVVDMLVRKYTSGNVEEAQDACYHKVRSRYKVWPSAYASGALVQCRKKGAANWGTGGKKK